MTELRTIIKGKIKCNLEAKVKGKVSVDIVDQMLIVDIIHKDIPFRFTLVEILQQVKNGKTCDYFTDLILKTYKKSIRNCFFR